jgi:hypothetical protein
MKRALHERKVHGHALGRDGEPRYSILRQVLIMLLPLFSSSSQSRDIPLTPFRPKLSVCGYHSLSRAALVPHTWLEKCPCSVDWDTLKV